jgi:hypothetical protein
MDSSRGLPSSRGGSASTISIRLSGNARRWARRATARRATARPPRASTKTTDHHDTATPLYRIRSAVGPRGTRERTDGAPTRTIQREQPVVRHQAFQLPHFRRKKRSNPLSRIIAQHHAIQGHVPFASLEANFGRIGIPYRFRTSTGLKAKSLASRPARFPTVHECRTVGGVRTKQYGRCRKERAS